MDAIVETGFGRREGGPFHLWTQGRVLRRGDSLQVHF